MGDVKSMHDELLEAADEKTREWEDFQQNTVIFSKQFADRMKEKAGVDTLRFHPGGLDAMAPDSASLPKAIRLHDAGWARVVVKFDVGHETIKVPVECKVHAGEAEMRVFDLQESFTWPIVGEQTGKLDALVDKVLAAVADDLRNDLELYMQGKMNRERKFS
ncbi:MAG: hypothetical protein JXR96_25780 [Deltaproteobacteria bacterium]|nr:hypothetical protein [Deltaproteobacteria bacterium]